VNQKDDVKLTFSQIGDLSEPSDIADEKIAELETNYAKFVASGKTRPLSRAIYTTFFNILLFSMMREIVLHTLEMSKPIMIGYLISIVSDKGISIYDKETIFVVLMNVFMNVITRNGWLASHMVIMIANKKVQASIKCLLLSKLLRLQQGSCPSSMSEGAILSLISPGHTVVMIIWRAGMLMYSITTIFWASIFLWSVYGWTFVITCTIMIGVNVLLTKFTKFREPIR